MNIGKYSKDPKDKSEAIVHRVNDRVWV